MKNISRQKLKNLKDIHARDYGVVLSPQQLSEFGERMLRMVILARKHRNRRLIDGLETPSRINKGLASSDKLGLD
ncbi:MAG: hypothetical protein LiPW15_616 [Parcubacteria group bacterium LiPW_15]|nr:MAG: hypothetical protein LiPW15_616 [Parcubacteria group bacterium LiPW_15]